MVICVTPQLDVYSPVSFALRAARQYGYHEWLSEADPMPGVIDVANMVDATIDSLREEATPWR